MAIELRPVRREEEALIFSFLILAARMPEGNEPIQKALSDPFLEKYWTNWGKAEDLGIVAADPETDLTVACVAISLSMWRTIVSRVTGQFYDAVVQHRAIRPGNRGLYGIFGNAYFVT